MKDKFMANIMIVLPAAMISLVLYSIFSPHIDFVEVSNESSSYLVVPYLLVIILALIGINVAIVLLAGILVAVLAGLFIGMPILNIFYVAGEGVDSVGSLIVITLLAAGMLGMIKCAGGIDFILKLVGSGTSSKRGAQLSIVLLVGIVNLCTANNTVAIITVGSLAKNRLDI